MNKSYKIYKKLGVLLLSVLIVFGVMLCGCKGQQEDSNEKDKNSSNGVAASDTLSLIADVYDGFLAALSNPAPVNSAVEMDMTMTFGDQILGQMASSSDMDMSWFESVHLDGLVNTKDGLTKAHFGIGVNDTDIIDAELFWDYEKSTAYLGLPDISNKYVKIPLEQVMGGPLYGSNPLSQYGDIADKLPSGTELEKVLRRYLTLAFNSLKKPEISETSLSVGTISQQVTKKNYKINKSDLIDVLLVLLNKAKNDKDLAALVTKLGNVVNEINKKNAQDGGCSYEDQDFAKMFKEGIPSAIEELEYQKENLSDGLVLEANLYYNGSEIRGLDITIPDYSTPFIKIYDIEKDGHTEFLFNILNDVSIRGSGETDGSVVSGSYAFYIEGQHAFDLTLSSIDVKALENGQLKGSASLAVHLESSVRFDCDFNTNSQGGEAKIKVFLDGTFCFGVDMKTKMLTPQAVSLPTNTVSAEDIESFVESINLDGIAEKLREAGFPQWMIDSFEQGYNDANTYI